MPKHDDYNVLKGDVAQVSWEQVAAFRLSRHHLSKRAGAGEASPVLGDIAGAQAQLLSAAQVAIWARVRDLRLQDLEAAIWEKRVMARAWCMRRTMYLLPSDSLALFVRGSARRAEREIRWVRSHGVSEQGLEELLDGVLKALEQQRTQTALARVLSQYLGYNMRYKPAGGWGSRRDVPWVEVGGLELPAGYLLHLAGARGVVCAGPGLGNESTFVRADRWVPHWKDMPVERAEKELLGRYLRAFGPATVSDFRLWTGMSTADAKEVWAREVADIAWVEVEGWKAAILRSDLGKLEKAGLDRPVVRLLPNFDSFVLGHESHRNIVGARHHRKVYRDQGWVSPVLLVDGRAEGVWSYARKKGSLEVRVAPFSRMSSMVASRVREEGADLGRFFGSPRVEVKIG